MRKADNPPPFFAVVTKSGNLNFLEPSGSVQACNGTALPLTRCSKICFTDCFKLALHVSGDSFAHLQEPFYSIYAFWNNVPTLLSAADRCHRSAADSRVGTLFQKAVYTDKLLLKVGETVVRNSYGKF